MVELSRAVEEYVGAGTAGGACEAAGRDCQSRESVGDCSEAGSR